MKTEPVERRRLELTGIVQGVGFRPFVYRLARSLGLSGWVANDTGGVCVEVQGEVEQIQLFTQKLSQEKPPPAEIHSLNSHPVSLQPAVNFAIRESAHGGIGKALILPDLAPCEDCLRELVDPDNRRFGYPFINCTRCGPRYSIIERLPYDRAHTSMRQFSLCEACQQEYTDPFNRRFHAEPIACPKCGPQLSLCTADGGTARVEQAPLEAAVRAIADGKILALKGVGGFQLLVDANNIDAVARLRSRKHRPDKPFALLYPDLASVRADCTVSALEEQLLAGPQRPIVLLKARAQKTVAENVAPQNPNLGVMLPASPLHHVLMRMLQRPVIATSGNLAGEPICIDNTEARQRLSGIADLFLEHKRPILRALDDSVLRVMDGQPVMLRRARGYAPLPVKTADGDGCVRNGGDDEPVLALGGDLKGCIASNRGDAVYLSQHLGDLENRVAMHHFEYAPDEMRSLYSIDPSIIAYDQHPAFFTHRWGAKQPLKAVAVQHHVAHFFSCMAEHVYRGPALGVSWDGSGYGEDGTIRGSEFIHWNGNGNVRRIACLRSFLLPGGEMAIREPRRILAALFYEKFGAQAFFLPRMQQLFDHSELRIIRKSLEQQINAPHCSSMGRLFDAVAVLLGVIDSVSFEGQAAMAVEFAAEKSSTKVHYPFELIESGDLRCLDWGPMLSALIEDGRHCVSVADRAAAFINTLAQMILTVARKYGEPRIFLSGGVFQNRRLLERSAALLRSEGYMVQSHSQVPPNDGGLSLGQIHFVRCLADTNNDTTGEEVDESRGRTSCA